MKDDLFFRCSVQQYRDTYLNWDRQKVLGAAFTVKHDERLIKERLPE